jgi:thiol-disulfide isomerase/thioredoxin
MPALPRRSLLAGLACLLAGPIRAETPDDPLPSASARQTAIAAGAAIDGLAMSGPEGQRVRLSAFRGHVVVLNFWAPWCLPCRKEMPSLSRLQSRLEGHDIRVVPLAFDWRGVIGVRQFYQESAITNLPILLGDGPNLEAVTGMSALPSTLILNREGRPIAKIIGSATWDDAATMAWLGQLAAAS